MLQKEGQVRIPAGCAISGIFHKDGARENGTRIIDSIRTMHDRSNGLGGGFAGYGIYPEYADYYAFHVFFDTQAAKDECEREYLRTHFDIVNLSKIPDPSSMPRITDEPMIWRYFVAPAADQARREPARRARVRRTLRHPHQPHASTARTFSPPARTWAYSRPVGFPEDVGEYYRLEELRRRTRWTCARPLSDQHARLVGRRASLRAAGYHGRPQRRDLLLRRQPPLYRDVRLLTATLLTDTEVITYMIDYLGAQARPDATRDESQRHRRAVLVHHRQSRSRGARAPDLSAQRLRAPCWSPARFPSWSASPAA